MLHSASQETLVLTVRFMQEQGSKAVLSELNSTIIKLQSSTSGLKIKVAQAESQNAAADTRQALLGRAFSTAMSPLAGMLLLGLASKLVKVSLDRHAIAPQSDHWLGPWAQSQSCAAPALPVTVVSLHCWRQWMSPS